MHTSFSTFVIIIQVISALVIIGLVLLQHGKGADMGASFGSGASGSLFGATGSSNFLSKSTGVAVAIFFSATMVLTYLGTNKAPSVGVMDNLSAAKVTASASSASASVVPAPAAAGGVASSAASAAGKSAEIPK
jgi:preprotein translocase subunit SecG